MRVIAPTAAGWTQEWPALAERVSDVRRAITHFARGQGLGPAKVGALRLAVSEACANVVMHAAGEQEPRPGTFVVGARRSAAGIEVTVRDHGSGMKPRPDSPGAGLGLGIIAELVDEVEVSTPPDGIGTELRMVVRPDG